MATFKCSQCGAERVKDLRTQRFYRGKTKYKSYCGRVERFIFMMKVGK